MLLLRFYIFFQEKRFSNGRFFVFYFFVRLTRDNMTLAFKWLVLHDSNERERERERAIELRHNKVVAVDTV